MNGSGSVIVAFQGQEAVDIYKKLMVANTDFMSKKGE